ncbi:MAG TPA: LysR family transcriptional regulator [Xanthobacteraceae bacterium]|jgi:DNA-binding transcriptional LysR family regulator|nr:LysR family transcriptional regulator [Xanthobacteraceae bacterium]
MNIRKLDLNLLVALDALLDERSVTRAAARLSMSQPALSSALHRLRIAFGDTLFTRGQRGLIPTERARALAEPLKQILREAEELVRQPVFDSDTAVHDFRVATTDYMLVTVIVPFLEFLEETAPNISVTARSLEFPDIPSRLANGDLELGIMIPEFAAPFLHAKHLYTDRYVGAVRKNHPLGDRIVTIEEFCRFPHTLIVPTGGSIRGPVDDALSAVGAKRKVRVSLPSFLALPYILRQTDLIAVGPERLFQKMSGELKLFEIPVSVPTFDIIAVWHPRVHNDLAHRWFRRKLAELADG